MTSADYLEQLQQDKSDLVDNLTTMGIEDLTGDETFTELVPEVLNIPSGGGGDDWSDIGYSSTPEPIEDIHEYSKDIYDNWDADNPYKFNTTEYKNNLIICPLIDTSKMSDMQQMFYECTALKEVPAISTSSANNSMNGMFNGCTVLKYLDLSSFNTTKIKNMGNLFQSCRNLTTLNLSSFDTSKVDTIFNLVNGCINLTTINFGNNFNLSSITNAGNMINMFYNCTKLDDNTLNQILHLCTTVNANFTGTKTLTNLGITSSFVNYANIPNLSNYQDFLDAGWTIS